MADYNDSTGAVNGDDQVTRNEHFTIRGSSSLRSSCQSWRRNPQRIDQLTVDVVKCTDLKPLAEYVMDQECKIKQLRVRQCAKLDLWVLGKSLRGNSSLTDLSFSSTTDSSLESIASGLRENRTLRRLHLCITSDAAVEAVGQMIRVNTNLRLLGLEKALSLKGLEEIARAMEHNVTIMHVNLHWRCTENEAAKRIQTACWSNRAGRKLLRSSSVPPGFWPIVLAFKRSEYEYYEGELDMIYFFLREVGAQLVPGAARGEAGDIDSSSTEQ